MLLLMPSGEHATLVVKVTDVQTEIRLNGNVQKNVFRFTLIWHFAKADQGSLKLT